MARTERAITDGGVGQGEVLEPRQGTSAQGGGDLFLFVYISQCARDGGNLAGTGILEHFCGM